MTHAARTEECITSLCRLSRSQMRIGLLEAHQNRTMSGVCHICLEPIIEHIRRSAAKVIVNVMEDATGVFSLAIAHQHDIYNTCKLSENVVWVM